MSKLLAENVEKIFMDCLYRENELSDQTPPDDAICVKGVNLHVGFHPGRIMESAPVICELINELPNSFRCEEGDSFLQMCIDKHGNLWTGLHLACDQLVVMGIAIGKIVWVLPREIWSITGGMPFLRIEQSSF